MWDKLADALAGVFEFTDDQFRLFASVFMKLQTLGGLFMGAWMIALSFVSRQMGGGTVQMQILIRLQIVGFCFGVLAALMGRGKHHPTFRSDVGIKGLSKKAAMWGWIWLVHQVDLSLGNGNILRNALVIGYNVFEAASIGETWVNMRWFGHRVIEMLLVWRIELLKQWVLDNLRPKDRKE
jgi:toxin secretion/phage lysis holin